MNPKNLNGFNKEQLKKWLESYDTILTDCNGVLWHDNHIIAQVPETINTLKTLGKNIYFITNNGTKTRHDLWLKASSMNYQIDEEHIIAPTHSIAEYLQQHLDPQAKVYVVGSEALEHELQKSHIKTFGTGPDLLKGVWVDLLKDIDVEIRKQKIGAVVVGFDEHFSFLKLLKTSHILGVNPDCEFLATNADGVHKYPKYCIPGTGAIVKSLETVVERKAKVMGKPNPEICETLIKKGVIEPKRTLMIGDCAKVDVLFGKNCGFETLLVGTGNYKWQQVLEFLEKKQLECLPDYYIESLGDLKKYLA